MQGWRYRMEDSHITAINQGPDKNYHIFGVFDGHGGKEVAQFINTINGWLNPSKHSWLLLGAIIYLVFISCYLITYLIRRYHHIHISKVKTNYVELELTKKEESFFYAKLNLQIIFDKKDNENNIIGIVLNNKVIYGKDTFTMNVDDYRFETTYNSFFQVNINGCKKIFEI